MVSEEKIQNLANWHIGIKKSGSDGMWDGRCELMRVSTFKGGMSFTFEVLSLR